MEVLGLSPEMFFRSLELFHASQKIINRSSKILCKPKFCLCDNGTNAGDNFNRSNDCSLSVLSATLPKSGPLNFPSEKSFLLFFAHEKYFSWSFHILSVN